MSVNILPPDSPDLVESSTTVGVGTGSDEDGSTTLMTSPPPPMIPPDQSPSILESTIAKLGLGAVVAILILGFLKFAGVV